MLTDRNKDEFENFLKQSADGLRMHPSEDSWTSTSNRLRDRRRKTGITSGVFFLITSLLGYFLIQNKEVVKPVATKAAVNTAKSYISKSVFRKAAEKIAVPVPVVSESALLQIPGKPQQFAVIRKMNVPLIIKQRPSQPTNEVAVTEVERTVVVEELALPSLATEAGEAPPEETVSLFDSGSVATEEKMIASVQPSSDVAPPADIVSNFNSTQKKNKLSFQVFFTPTVSYRKLSENKAYLNSVPQPNATINYAVLYNVNDAVTHKPDMGLELGFTAKYEVADHARLRAGLQFNISRYDIKAFTYPTEVAQIALNNSPSGINYVGTTTNYRNFGGGNANWLQNMYFQVSAPLGAEIRLAKTKNATFGIAGTLQPTYVLGDRAYLISTDYKNYTEVPWLMRRWNVNTSFETFVAYSTGKMNWQVGPQIRYQVLSSFVTEYPVRENLFDFGLKVGVSLNKNK